jgi:hypothetical protein
VLKPVLDEVLDRMRTLIADGGDPQVVVEHVIAVYGRPNRRQAEAMARVVPGAASALMVQLAETGGRGPDTPEPSPDIGAQLKVLDYLYWMTLGEQPVEVLAQLTAHDRARLLEVIDKGEAFLADLRDRATSGDNHG